MWYVSPTHLPESATLTGRDLSNQNFLHLVDSAAVGRPSKGLRVQITLRLPVDVMLWLEQHVQSSRMERNEYLLMLLRREIEREGTSQ